jgi:hypothetical protein
MKAEERHRLHENELQRLAVHARERTRPFLDRYGTTLLLALAAVLVVVAAIVWWSKLSGASREAGWDELSAVFRKPNGTAEDFANVAELYPDTAVAAWAKLYEGEAHLDSGIESLFTDKQGAVRDLTDARTAFEAALESKKAGRELAVRALYGLARTLETTSDGDLKPALERYQQIADDYGDSVYATLAQQRIETLKSSDAKSFYAWFSKQEPAPKDPLSRPFDSGFSPGSSPFGGPGFGPLGGTPSSATSSPKPIEAPRPKSAPAEKAAPDGANATGSTETETPAAPAEKSDDSATPDEKPAPVLPPQQ